MKSRVKDLIQEHSDFLRFLRFVPFKYRLGKEYIAHKKLIQEYESFSSQEKEEYHYINLKRILLDAYKNNSFYRDFYDRHSYNPNEFRSLELFSEVPIVTKEDFKRHKLENRSLTKSGSMLINTGGTSGQPLNFFIDTNAFSREWAYMHTIWERLGYSYLDYKLTMRGKDNKGKPLQYNVIHNEFIVDSYVSPEVVLENILKLTKKVKIKYLHGYPSSIFSFCMFLIDSGVDANALFKNCLKGVFLGSEYPAPHYREVIEKVLGVPSISWYGHSEMNVLAYEKSESYKYHPFQTYGFVEALERDEDSNKKLIGTSYYNDCSHFIRYDTSDLIDDDLYVDGILDSFTISRGRVGDFILDKEGNSISLTSLIFGRHHKCFDYIRHIQVQQLEKGKATLLVCAEKSVELDDFYLENVDMDFEVVELSNPIKSISGKVPLLVKKNNI